MRGSVAQSAIDSPILRRVVACQVLFGEIAEAALRGWRIAPIGLLALLAVVAGSIAIVGNVVAGIIAAILESARRLLIRLSRYIAHCAPEFIPCTDRIEQALCHLAKMSMIQQSRTPHQRASQH